jgi:hypothetical protein
MPRATKPLKERATRIAVASATLALLLSAAALSRSRVANEGAPNPVSTPDECLSRLTQAARDGDVTGYVDCFAGPMRAEIESQVANAPSREEFAAQLRASLANLKGFAAFDESPPSETTARMVLERIYQGHNDRYRVSLARENDVWRVVQMSRIGADNPPVEYGTPVFQIDEQ